jgi:putative flavoprotein involved in K+ transport
MNANRNNERFDTVIIGGGQAGLAVGYHLARMGRPFVILDAGEQVGDAWRTRWDSLRVFTPAKYDGLPGMRFPAPSLSFPTKDEVADYLAAYARRFDLPIRNGAYVQSVSREGARYVVASGDSIYEADNVVVATGSAHTPEVPAFAKELDPGVTQLHSSAYKSPQQLRDGGVLIVGAGNSGAEISFEVARTHKTWLAGPSVGAIPFRHGPAAAALALPLIQFMASHVLTMDTPVGRKVLPKMARHGAPLIRVKIKDLEAMGVERVPRVAGVRNGAPLLADDRVLDVANVIWCTGFRTDFEWIHVPAFGPDGQPVHYRGVVSSQPGLYFVGLEFTYAATSPVLPGIGRDANYTAKHIVSRGAITRLAGDAAGSLAIQRVS